METKREGTSPTALMKFLEEMRESDEQTRRTMRLRLSMEQINGIMLENMEKTG
jgi:hypothetical protein